MPWHHLDLTRHQNCQQLQTTTKATNCFKAISRNSNLGFILVSTFQQQTIHFFLHTIQNFFKHIMHNTKAMLKSCSWQSIPPHQFLSTLCLNSFYILTRFSLFLPQFCMVFSHYKAAAQQRKKKVC